MLRFKFVIACVVLAVTSVPVGADVEKFDVRFNSGDAVIAGTFVAPAADGPHPGMVMVGGSGPFDREHLLEMAEDFAREGLAVLAYDKRGTGASGGSWQTSSLDVLAKDAAAAFAALAERSSVDAERIGYWGISQGGWVVPLAAGQTPLAFAIVVSGGGLSPRAVETHNYLSIVDRVDGSMEANREIRQLLDDYFGYLAGERSREDLMRTMDQARDQAWFAAIGIERVIPAVDNRQNWAWVANFQPGPSIAALEAPVLVLLGGSDPLTPAERTAQAWREALAEGEPGGEVVIVPDAGHGLRSGPHGGPLVADYYPLQLQWLIDIGILQQR